MTPHYDPEVWEFPAQLPRSKRIRYCGVESTSMRGTIRYCSGALMSSETEEKAVGF